jgi:hypothetical protein
LTVDDPAQTGQGIGIVCVTPQRKTERVFCIVKPPSGFELETLLHEVI